ncbi:MAG: DUF362 domain-containing protein [bacterium]|nr:DUF362 domain-containing protein [bacterium]
MRAVVRPGVVGVASLDPSHVDALNAPRARKLIGDSLCAAVGEDSPKIAIRKLFSASDVVGIKVNCLAGRELSPRPMLVEALVHYLEQGGVERKRVIVFERSSRELQRAGFELNRGGVRQRCFGVDNDWDRNVSVSGEIGSCFARLVTSGCTALIGFGVVKDHDLAGVSASLKNWYGVIHNPNKYHDNNCDPYVADVVRHEHIQNKLRLTVLDGLRAQCDGGPAYRASGVFSLGKVAASTDPVAADVWAWKQLDAERLRRGMPSLKMAERPPRFIATAQTYGLGVGDAEKLREVAV